MPSWVVDKVRAMAVRHPYLEEAFCQGHDIIRSQEVLNIMSTPLLHAVREYDIGRIQEEEIVDKELHIDALALAAAQGSLEIVRELLLKPGGLQAVHAPVVDQSGGVGTLLHAA